MNETLGTLHELRTIHGNFADSPIAAGNLTAVLRAAGFLGTEPNHESSDKTAGGDA